MTGLTVGGILSFLTVLLTAIVKFWPDPKTQSELDQAKMQAVKDSEQKFDATKDTTDLGNIP